MLCTDVFVSLQHDLRNNSLQLASLEQKRADENVLRAVEEQKVCATQYQVFTRDQHIIYLLTFLLEFTLSVAHFAAVAVSIALFNQDYTGSTMNGEDEELIPKNGILSFFYFLLFHSLSIFNDKTLVFSFLNLRYFLLFIHYLS